MLLYYFLTGLKPVLVDGPLPISSDDFLRCAQDSLSEDIAEDLQLLKTTGAYFYCNKIPYRSAFLRAFVDEAILIYGVMASALMKKDELSDEAICEEFLTVHDDGPIVFHRPHKARAILLAAFDDPDPLVLERALTLLLFSQLDHMTSLDPFSVDQVFVYFIKLLLCERWLSFDEARGQEILDKLVSEVRQKINE